MVLADQEVREDVLDSADRVERGLDLALALDSAVDHRVPAPAACCPDRAKVLRLDVPQDAPRSVVAAISVTRRAKKAR